MLLVYRKLAAAEEHGDTYMVPHINAVSAVIHQTSSVLLSLGSQPSP